MLPSLLHSGSGSASSSGSGASRISNILVPDAYTDCSMDMES